ncbi:tRNA (guanine-N(7)-)-methyltransferase non-catalytic subunit wdr4 [Eucyclogobius newberryi]|uniref:tRNA (guanine-N(7)-)-methyltransferase non-catalytic subunit wdr4 n=1 Tax=Eucyclogobius newberryi TaxID=166745 RepID=UPI003B5C2B0E
MAAAQFCGEWFICSCDKRLLAVHSAQDRAPFEFDCGSAAKRPKKVESDPENTNSGEHEAGSDQILAIAASASGTLLALSDDSKRLVLLRREPTWAVVSVRWLARRCTALFFTRAEDSLLVADKSGDVYSASVKEPEQEPVLQLGHLSMVLDVTVSLDDLFIVTCDRDEKIRVSWSRSPHSIQSFCLGHQQFVSSLLVPAGGPRSLLSGAGDGTVRLWDMDTGRRLQTVELKGLLQPREEAQEQRLTVSRLRCSPDGRHVAVLCERLKQIQLLCLEQSEGGTVLTPHSILTLSHCPLDLTFDPQGRLWVLLNCAERPLQVYRQTQGSYEQVDAENPEVSRVSTALRPLWDSVDECGRSSSRLDNLYVETYDNVSEYMKKKQQRLEQQSHKRSHKKSQDHSQDHNQTKKSKTESSTEANGS